MNATIIIVLIAQRRCGVVNSGGLIGPLFAANQSRPLVKPLPKTACSALQGPESPRCRRPTT